MMMKSQETIEHAFAFGREQIKCLIHLDNRERLKITVNPDQSVVVNAPACQPLDIVFERIRKRAGWIFKQINYFEQFMPRQPQMSYVSGESIYYLGRQYRLRVRCDENKSAKLSGKFLMVTVPETADSLQVKEQVDKWYRLHAQEIFTGRLEACYQMVKSYDIPFPVMKIRAMKKRWGSCSRTGNNILLNTNLVKSPRQCIDYVIIHELCHLKYPAHSDNFYGLLGLVLPEWRKSKERLEKVGI